MLRSTSRGTNHRFCRKCHPLSQHQTPWYNNCPMGVSIIRNTHEAATSGSQCMLLSYHEMERGCTQVEATWEPFWCQPASATTENCHRSAGSGLIQQTKLLQRQVKHPNSHLKMSQIIADEQQPLLWLPSFNGRLTIPIHYLFQPRRQIYAPIASWSSWTTSHVCHCRSYMSSQLFFPGFFFQTWHSLQNFIFAQGHEVGTMDKFTKGHKLRNKFLPRPSSKNVSRKTARTVKPVISDIFLPYKKTIVVHALNSSPFGLYIFLCFQWASVQLLQAMSILLKSLQ